MQVEHTLLYSSPVAFNKLKLTVSVHIDNLLSKLTISNSLRLVMLYVRFNKIYICFIVFSFMNNVILVN